MKAGRRLGHSIEPVDQTITQAVDEAGIRPRADRADAADREGLARTARQ
jgi:hypothetical protein